jgi:hypothetical protein
MAEIVDLDAVLKKLQGFSPLQRMVLATPGTLQATLAAFFGEPVTIRVLHQNESDAGLHREVDLVCPTKNVVVCHAVTEAHVTDPKIRRLILETEMGLGQITAALKLQSSYALDEVGQNTAQFWRLYQLSGDGFSFRIRETFPNKLYRDDKST